GQWPSGVGVSQKRPTELASVWQPQLRRSFCYSRESTPIKLETKTKKSHRLHLRPKQDRPRLPSRVVAVSMDRCPRTSSFPPARRRLSITLATRRCSFLTARRNGCGGVLVRCTQC